MQPSVIAPVPAETARVARAAFPKGNVYLAMRDELGTIFTDADFAALFPRRGQPAFPPWRLALVTVMQFMENLSDRQAADAVRARLDWKYALSLELIDSGFDYSVLSGFRERLIEGKQNGLLLDRLLEVLREKKLLKARGRQRTDSTYVLARIRTLNRLELVAKTMRAALNQVATVAPDWLASVAPDEWFQRYSLRVEQSRLPWAEKAREEYAAQVGADGEQLLALLQREQPFCLALEKVMFLAKVWELNFTRDVQGGIGFRPAAQMARAAHSLESPYDAEARHSRRDQLPWTGYKVHLSETCDEELPRLITNVHTTVATEQDVSCTEAIQASLQEKSLLPERHLVDAGYVDAELLAQSAEKYGVELFGPPRLNKSWQAREGGFTHTAFQIDWEQRKAMCPAGRESVYWHEYRDQGKYPRQVTKVRFRKQDCQSCESRVRCAEQRRGAFSAAAGTKII